MRKMLLFLLVITAIAASAQDDSVLRLPGHLVRLTQQGFPEQVQTDTAHMLAENIHFHFFRKSDGKDIRLKAGGLKRVAGSTRWQAASSADELRMDVDGLVGQDGVLRFTVKVTALQDLDLKDIVMHIPFEKEMATFMKGLGRDSSSRPDSMYHWKWDGQQEAKVWIGVPYAGLAYVLRGASWSNGGIDIGIKGKSMLANNYSGPRSMKNGDVLAFNFDLLVTPAYTQKLNNGK